MAQTSLSLIDHLERTLKTVSTFAPHGVLLKNKIIAAAQRAEEPLLTALLEDPTLRHAFFKEVKGALVFNTPAFQEAVNQHAFLQNSYTAFRNKIGLAANRNFLHSLSEVVLDFPYKDCVLQGAQTHERAQKNEQFWHTTLAAQEIDRLFEPKVLHKWERIDAHGTQTPETVKETDSFLIRGNNLLVLHSLKYRYAEQVKLIYIDPPYNTGNDGFNYNDRFNHTTWLVFMKNRLEIARTLLRPDGILYISCDDREHAYLKILCDEIFGREHYITSLIWRKKAGGANDSQDIAVEHEYILTYRKEKNGIYKIPIDAKTVASYKGKDEKFETHGPFKTKDLNDPSLSDSPGLHFDIECPDGTILRGTDHQWKCNEATFRDRLANGRIVFKKVKDRWKVHYKIYLNEEKGQLRQDAAGNIIPRGRNLSSILYDVALNKDGNQDLKSLFDGKSPFSYPKPVKLLEQLIVSATKAGDLVLDFFAGSGTTAEAVIALNQKTEKKRRFILVEQMEYIEDITAPRLQKALSKYQSSESFVYAALKPLAALWAEQVQLANSQEELKTVWETMQHSGYADCQASAQLANPTFIQELFSLPLSEAKQFLLETLDVNAWYVSLFDLENADFSITETDKALNRAFYPNDIWKR